MNLKKIHNALVKLEQAEKALESINYYESANEISGIYCILKDAYFEALAEAKDIENEMKGK